MRNPFRRKAKRLSPEQVARAQEQAHVTVGRAGRAHLTHYMMGAAISVYIAETVLLFSRGEGAVNSLIDTYGFSLAALQAGRWWTPFTSVFLHGGADHLFFNVLALYFFGTSAEKVFGRVRWLAIFFSAAFVGCAAVLVSSFLGVMPADIPTIGMSGAIFGLMGAAMLARPTELVIHPYIIPLPLLLIAAIYIVYNVVAFADVLMTGAEANVAYAAHIGGVIAGSLFGFREAGKKQGAMVLFFLLLVFAAVPFVWGALESLQTFNWVNAVQQLFVR